MTRERLSKKIDENNSPFRKRAQKGLLKATIGGGSFVAGMSIGGNAVAQSDPGQPLARPNAFALVNSIIDAIKSTSGDDPNMTFIDPKFAVRFAQEQCTVDGLTTLKVTKLKPGSKAVEVALRRTQGVVELGIAGNTAHPDNSGTFNLSCDILNGENDTVTPVRRKSRKAPFMADGASVAVPPQETYSVLPAGEQPGGYNQTARLKFRHPLTARDIKLGLVGTRVTNGWESHNKKYGTTGGKAVGVYGPLKKQGQIINPRRQAPLQAKSSSHR